MTKKAIISGSTAFLGPSCILAFTYYLNLREILNKIFGYRIEYFMCEVGTEWPIRAFERYAQQCGTIIVMRSDDHGGAEHFVGPDSEDRYLGKNRIWLARDEIKTDLTNSGAYVFPWHEFKHSRPLLKRELELFFRQNFRRSWHDRFLNIF